MGHEAAQEPVWREPLRRAIGIAGSQKKFAERCGMSQNAVWATLHRGRRVNGQILLVVAALTKTRLLDLLPPGLPGPRRRRRKPAQ